MNKMSSDKIEKSIIDYFEYISNLQKKIRQLKRSIRQEQQILEKNKAVEKYYLNMLVSDCTGKGAFHDCIMLPVEIKSQIESSKNLSPEEKEKLNIKYESALEYAKTLQQRYLQLQATEKQRLEQIKKSKSNIKKYSNDLKKKNKEHEEKMNKIKMMEKELEKIKPDQSKSLSLKNENKE